MAMFRLCSVVNVAKLFGVVFLLLQLTVYNKFSFKVYDGVGIGTAGKQGLIAVNGRDLQEIISLFKDVGISLILIDKEALAKWQRVIDQILPGMKSKRICRVLCGKELVTFAITDDRWDLDKARKIYYTLFKNNIPFIVDYGNDPRSTKWSLTGDPIVYHLWLRGSSGGLLQIVIFYRRGSGSYLWHGPATNPSKFAGYTINPSDVHFGLDEGAYDRFGIFEVTVDGFRLFIPRDIKNFIYQSNLRYVMCNMTRATTFYLKYGKDLSPQAKTFYYLSEELLGKVVTVLSSLRIPFWLSSGTCLGWFRQCGIISYSKDLDIGVMAHDYDNALINAMKKHGFTLRHIFGKLNDSFELSFMYKGIKLDIFFFYQENSYIWNGGTQAKTGLKFKYIFPKFTLCWTEFLNLKVRVPCETREYIEANYGINWFTPVKNWNWKDSPPNVMKNGKWNKEEWSNVIQVFD